MWTCWKRCDGNSTASPAQPEDISADPFAGSNFAERLHCHRLGVQKSRPGGSASAANSYRHCLFGADVAASLIHQSNQKEDQ
jgi:hypothetical protein